MSNRLAGKRALITAAAQGIGRACAEAFAAEGAEVLATDINQAALESLAELNPGIRVAELDVQSPSAIAALAGAEPAFDVLLNCAGFVHHGTILDCSDDDWSFSFDLNVTSMFRLTKALLPAMLEAGGASIVNVSSVASSIRGVPNRFVYGASKAAIIGLTKAVAADFVGRGIRCNAICPGWVRTPLVEKQIEALADRDGGDIETAAKKLLGAKQPSAQFVTPEQLGQAAVFLCSAAADQMTGADLTIDGGWTAQ